MSEQCVQWRGNLRPKVGRGVANRRFERFVRQTKSCVYGTLTAVHNAHCQGFTTVVLCHRELAEAK
jgi:hypothetical protein